MKRAGVYGGGLAREPCDRCGAAPRVGGRVPWCGDCVNALRTAPTAQGRREYKLAYQRLYARARRAEVGSAILRWVVGNVVVTLRRASGKVTVCGESRRVDEGRRLVSDVLGLKIREEAFGGGGSGARAQKTFRLTALAQRAACDELARRLTAAGGRTPRASSRSGA